MIVEDMSKESRDRIVKIAMSLEAKIKGLKFKETTSNVYIFNKELTASTALFSYKGDDIELALGFESEGDTISLPQDLKVSYNFRPDETEGIKESIERCLKNGWINTNTK